MKTRLNRSQPSKECYVLRTFYFELRAIVLLPGVRVSRIAYGLPTLKWAQEYAINICC